jgi:hypothetical protein
VYVKVPYFEHVAGMALDHLKGSPAFGKKVTITGLPKSSRTERCKTAEEILKEI